MAGKPIPISAANQMIADYSSYMEKLGVDMNTQTQSVSFASDAFLAWLTPITRYLDELRVFMGLYPEDSARAGRTTVIIWPYKDGKPATQPATTGKGDDDDQGINPYNEGTLFP